MRRTPFNQADVRIGRFRRTMARARWALHPDELPTLAEAERRMRSAPAFPESLSPADIEALRREEPRVIVRPDVRRRR